MLESLKPDSDTINGIIKPIAYAVSALFILSLVISISVMDSKMHSRMIDDEHNLVRIDTKEGVTTIVLICLIAFTILSLIPFIDGLKDISGIIPEYAKSMQIDVSYLNGIIEMIVFAIVIIGLNVKSHDKMFSSGYYVKDSNIKTGQRWVPGGVRKETEEGISTLVFICFIALIVFTFIMKYLSSSWGSMLDFIPNVLFYIVVIALSVVLWMLKMVYQMIAGSLDASSGSIGSKAGFIFNDFEASMIPNYGLLFGLIGIVLLILYNAVYDPASLTTNTYAYLLTIVIPIMFAFSYVVPILNTDNGSGYGKIAGIVMAIVMFFAAVYFYINMNTVAFETTSYLSGILILIIILVGLALSFYMLSNYLKSFTGLPGFIIYFIFYIPCLVIDFATYLLKEFKMTSKVVYVLFFVEILLIILYVYVPKILNAVDKKDGIILLENGAFLDIPKSIGSSKLLQISKNNLENTNLPIVYQTNFSFSMWIYLNIQPTNFGGYTQEMPIFNFGDGKPMIVYHNNITDEIHKNKYRIYFTNLRSSENFYEVTLPNQKWNNFVFNYKSSQVDLFINGELVKVFKFTDNRPIYKASDDIMIGKENGLDGAICNIRYYPYNLTMSHITSTYNLLMYKNPPVAI
jgi:hypothetical protein